MKLYISNRTQNLEGKKKKNNYTKQVFLYNKANDDQIKEKINNITLNNIAKVEELTMDQLWNNVTSMIDYL